VQLRELAPTHSFYKNLKGFSSENITLFSELWPPRGFSPFFLFFQTARKHSGTKTSSGFPPLANQ
jgi:hypothetical protein